MNIAVLYPLGAVLCWTFSTLIISAGLKQLRNANVSPVQGVIFGMLASLTAGVLVQGLIVYLRTGTLLGNITVDGFTIVGGLLIFPIGTGLYYGTAVAYQNRAELSSQYTNVKPLISIGIGFFIFHELLTPTNVVVLAIIAVGIGMLLWRASGDTQSYTPVILGLLLACVWSVGEGFVKAAADVRDGGVVSFNALLFSLLSTVCVGMGMRFYGLVSARRTSEKTVTPITSTKNQHSSERKAYLAFFLHGAISFGCAYFLYFQSIAHFGLIYSVMTTMFWPTLALGLAFLIAQIRHQKYGVSPYTVVSFGLFTVGSVLYILTSFTP